MAELAQLRAADSDRERAAGDLREHYAAGRLNAGELSERLEAAYAATTLAELDGLRADLPDPRPLPVLATPRELARRRIYQDAGAGSSFWPIWVILVSALRLARDAWRLLGPDGSSAPRERRRGSRRRRRGLLSR